jgi:ATP-dependent Clp protease ATP-binding subunit ClpC
MTLYQLRKLVRQDFPDEKADLVRLLASWTKHDTSCELSGFLEYTGISTEIFYDVLLRLLCDESEEDDKLLTACLLARTDGPLLATHILAAVADAPANRINLALLAAGCDIEVLRKNLSSGLVKKKGTLASQGIEVNEITNPLLRFGRDLTELAKSGEFDSLCDRPIELDRLTEILLRKEKGNPAITGLAGVGKTALVELLARSIAKAAAPASLADAQVFEVSMSRVVAGTKYRGDFEARMEEIMTQVSGRKNAILFIDEMHLIWGAGRAEGVIMDAANILKPFLSRGQIRVIGATTIEEYHRHIAQDAALARRFQELRLDEPDKELTLDMVSSQASSLAEYHSVRIPKDIVIEAIRLTDKHVPGRFQPDKSVDLLDTCCVNALRTGKNEITRTDLANTLARTSGIPVSSITGDTRAALRGLFDGLSKRIIGQDDAVGRVVATFTRRRQGLGPADKNLGSFLFAGETGVGKTELARVMAEVMFIKRTSLLALDLAEYNQGAAVNKLIGSPPGYAGSEKEGVLADWLHTTGSGVILFDEIEKAHPDVHKLILGLLDTGRIMSGKGEKLDARQCIVVLTTNAIKHEDLGRASIGFARTSAAPDLTDILEDHFPRELLGRLDEVILFNSLTDDITKKIILMKLDEALSRLAEQEISATYDKDIIGSYLFDCLGKDKSGARGIERLIENRILQPISIGLLNHEGVGAVSIVLGEKLLKEGLVDLDVHEE